jgi:hypothetical protein
MKKIGLSTVACMVVASTISASTTSQEIALNNGWNLIGTENSINTSELSNTKIAWTYNNGNWSVKAFDSTLNEQTEDLTQIGDTIEAGTGFWVYSEGNKQLSLKGTAPTNTSLNIAKKGWQLKSLKSNDALITSGFSDVASVWTYDDGKWGLYVPNATTLKNIINNNPNTISKLSSINSGQGFWVNANTDSAKFTAPPSIIVGTVNLEGLEDDTTSDNLGRVLYNTIETPPAIPGLVQVYDATDTDYENPLLNDAVELEDDGSYNISENDFVNKDDADSSKSFIIRAIVEKELPDGTKAKYDLSALKTEGKEVEVSPITTAIKSQILNTITSIFGEKFELGGEIMSTVNLLSNQIAKQVKQDIKDKKMSLSQAQFVTDAKISKKDTSGETAEQKAQRIATEKAKRAEQEAKMALQISSKSRATTDLAILTNQLSNKKKQEITKDLSTVKASDISQNEDIARLQYDIVSTFTKIGLGVHDGNGQVVMFLPVPAEEFHTLPGKKYQVFTKDDSNNTVVVGNDPALRVIDIQTDLKNIRADEVWLPELSEKVLHMPIVPFNGVISIMKNLDSQITIKELGEFLAGYTDPSGEGKLFDTDPFAKLKDTQLSTDIDDSVKNILRHYKKDFLLQEFDWIFHEKLDKVMHNVMNPDIGIPKQTELIKEFINTFKVPKDLSSDNRAEYIKEMLSGLEAEAEEVVEGRLHHMYGLIADGIPFDDGSDKLDQIQFKDGVIINGTSTLDIKTAVMMTALAMNTQDSPTLKPKQLSDLVNERLGWLPENIKSVLKDLDPNPRLWITDWESMDDGTSSNEMSEEDMMKEERKFNRKFIVDIISKVSVDTTLNPEPSYTMLLSNINKVAQKIEEDRRKYEDNHFKDQFNEEFNEAEIFKDGKIDTQVTFKVVKFDGMTNTAVSAVEFTPILEDIYTKEHIESENSVVFKNQNGSFNNTITLYPYSKPLDIKGNPSENGKFRQTDMFEVTVYQGSEEYNIGHFPIFTQETNDLNEIWFDSSEQSYGGEYEDYNTDTTIYQNSNHFQEFAKDAKDQKLFYPNFVNKNGTMLGENILKFDNATFSLIDQMAGTLSSDNNGKVEMYKLASDYNQSDDVWMNNKFYPSSDASPISSFTVGTDIQQGGIILVKVSSDQLQPKEMLLTIDYNDEANGYIGVNLMDVPKVDMSGMYSDDNTEFEDMNTTVYFKIKKFDGSVNNSIKNVIFTPYMKESESTEWELKEELSTTIKPSIGGEFKTSIELKKSETIDSETYFYTGEYDVSVLFINDKGGEETQHIGVFPLFPKSENFLGDMFFDTNINNYTPNGNTDDQSYFEENKFPDQEMDTKVTFTITDFTDSVNNGVKGMKITPIFESEKGEWKPIYTKTTSVTGITGGKVDTTVKLYKEDTKITQDTQEWKYTGDFEFIAIMDDGKEFPVGQFPLFAIETNDLQHFIVDMDNMDFGDYFDK